jgi:hypothetical protein
MPHKLGDIIFPISQGQYVEAQYVESVIQIAPEISKIDLPFEPPVGGGNDTDIYGYDFI